MFELVIFVYLLVLCFEYGWRILFLNFKGLGGDVLWKLVRLWEYSDVRID